MNNEVSESKSFYKTLQIYGFGGQIIIMYIPLLNFLISYLIKNRSGRYNFNIFHEFASYSIILLAAPVVIGPLLIGLISTYILQSQ